MKASYLCGAILAAGMLMGCAAKPTREAPKSGVPTRGSAMAFTRDSKIEDVRNDAAFSGFGLGTGTSTEGWLRDAVHFWEKQM